jgi:hypothetical protein
MDKKKATVPNKKTHSSKKNENILNLLFTEVLLKNLLRKRPKTVSFISISLLLTRRIQRQEHFIFTNEGKELIALPEQSGHGIFRFFELHRQDEISYLGYRLACFSA